MARPEHNYPPTLVSLVVNMAEGNGKTGPVRAMSAKRLASFAGAPSLRTIELWRKRARTSSMDSTSTSPQGRPPLLSEAEKNIIGGWALRRVQAGKLVSIRAIQAFSKVENHPFEMYRKSRMSPYLR